MPGQWQIQLLRPYSPSNFLGHPCCCTWAWRLVVNCFIIGTASHRCSNLLILCTSPHFQATMSPPTFRNHPPPGGPAGGSQLDASEIARDENECKWVPMDANSFFLLPYPATTTCQKRDDMSKAEARRRHSQTCVLC